MKTVMCHVLSLATFSPRFLEERDEKLVLTLSMRGDCEVHHERNELTRLL